MASNMATTNWPVAIEGLKAGNTQAVLASVFHSLLCGSIHFYKSFFCYEANHLDGLSWLSGNAIHV
jgi:hypothetical protein